MMAVRALGAPVLVVACIAPLLLVACDTWPLKRGAAESDEMRDDRLAITVDDEQGDRARGTQPVGADEKDGRDGVADLVAYANGLRALDAAALDAEYREVEERFARTHDPRDRLRLAILLMEPGASFRDVDRARALLEDYLTDSASYVNGFAYRDVAFFLLRFPGSMQQAGVSQTSVSRQLDAERARSIILSRRVESLQAELARIRTERVKLQEQVEALKSIEETLRARGQAGEERLKR